MGPTSKIIIGISHVFAVMAFCSHRSHAQTLVSGISMPHWQVEVSVEGDLLLVPDARVAFFSGRLASPPPRYRPRQPVSTQDQALVQLLRNTPGTVSMGESDDTTLPSRLFAPQPDAATYQQMKTIAECPSPYLVTGIYTLYEGPFRWGVIPNPKPLPRIIIVGEKAEPYWLHSKISVMPFLNR